MSTKIKVFFILLVVFACTAALAHKDSKHSEEGKKVQLPPDTFQRASVEYDKRIKPIFQKKCYDCHGSGNKLPFYASWPVIRWLIQHDIEEGKEHVDMTKGFPFAGHGTNLEDLEAINETAGSGDMPPMRYRLMHWDTDLTEEETRIVKHWVSRTYHRNLAILGPSKKLE